MIDPAALKEAVDAHVHRLETVWDNDRTRHEDPMVLVREGARAQQQVEAVELDLPDMEMANQVEAVELDLPELSPVFPNYDPKIVGRLDAIERALSALTEAVVGNREPSVIPPWLQASVGDPRSYDVPDSARMSVKVRMLPNLYARLEQTQTRFGLQTLTGTWECLLRLGLAAADRLPVRGGVVLTNEVPR